LVEEHAAFPIGQHDDQVDTTVMALATMSHMGSWQRSDPQVVRWGGAPAPTDLTHAKTWGDIVKMRRRG
jgi:hypothetical protein